MAKRRSNNEGTIRQRSNGSWRALISINGTRLSKTYSTKAACVEWIRETKNNIDSGFNPSTKKVRLSDFMADWLVILGTYSRPSTIKTYQWIITHYIDPNLGAIWLNELTPSAIQSMYESELKKGTSRHAVRQSHKVLHSALQHAVRLGQIPRNPVDGTTPPSPEKREMKFLDENQVQTLLISAEQSLTTYYPIYFLAIHTGMRQGEILGLRWEDLNWTKNSLNIHRQLVYLGEGHYEFTPPKTKSGRRTITLGTSAMNVLKSHHDNQFLQRKKKAEKWMENGLIFPSGIGTPITASNLRRSFRNLLKRSGLPKIRFHDLRHTAASLMLNNGIPVLIVSKRLGHSKASLTLDVYGHLIPQHEEEAVKLMDTLMTPISLPTVPKLYQGLEK